MAEPDIDRTFAGSIPQLYDEYLVPLIFEPYAADLAARVASRQPSSVLEIAAGTGAVTRHLAAMVPPTTTIVATDLNQTMLGRAAAVGGARPVQWLQADASDLPFADDSFDVVACQFGAMFFPNKPKAFSEARRVLRAGGAFIFNVWDGIEDNEFADVVTLALAKLFPDDPPRFLARTPHGYADPGLIASHLAQGGFDRPPAIFTVAETSRAPSADIAAMAYCEGTPLRGEIEARGSPGLAATTGEATAALRSRFGSGPIEGKIQAIVIVAER